jgi:hypothetical protein
LDRAVFGAIKAIFRRTFEERGRMSPDKPARKADGMDMLADIWEERSPHLIHRGWALDEDDFGPGDGDADDAEWKEQI